MMELKLSRAYIACLFEEAKHARTFSVEANAMLREITEPGVFITEFFEYIDKAPATRFEAHLKRQANLKANAQTV